MHDVIFVVNPRASSGRAASVWDMLKKHAPLVRQARHIIASSPREAHASLVSQLHPGIRRVIALGGDGTVNSTATTLLEKQHPATLGLIPVGSGSDMARSLQIEHQPRAALKRALYAEPRALDALRFRQRNAVGWVVNIASVGLSGLVADDVNALHRRRAGTYLWAALKALHRYKPADFSIHLDGRHWFEGPVLLCAVANGSAFARGMQIAPNAMSNDGLADIVLVKAVPLLQVLPWVPRLYNGSHLRAPFVCSARARTIDIKPLGQTPSFEADGEPFAAQETAFTLVPSALKVAY